MSRILSLDGKPFSKELTLPKSASDDKSRKKYFVSTGVESIEDRARAELKGLLTYSNISELTKERKSRSLPAIGKASTIKEQPIMGKDYPGSHNLLGLRAMAWSSTVVYSIISFRRNQIAKKNLILVPKEKEPSPRFSVLEYSNSEILQLPELNESEKYSLLEIFRKIDPFDKYQRKLEIFEKAKGELSTLELELIDYLNNKHKNFHQKETQIRG